MICCLFRAPYLDHTRQEGALVLTSGWRAAGSLFMRVCGLGVVAHFAFESGRERAKIAISEDAEGYSEAEEGT
jgi:hypothetical protein